MKNPILLLALSALTLVGCGGKTETKTYNRGINVIPVPLELAVTDSIVKFTIQSSTSIGITSEDFKVPADYLAAKIKNATGYEIKVGESGEIMLEMNPRVAVGHEGYLLTSTAEGVKIEARTPQGAFYGVQTLLQLLPAEIESPLVIKGIAWEMPLVTVKDEPRFRYRGMMLDVARHFASVEDIKRQLDVLAMFKINRFHWHLTEDQGWRIEIKQYPELTAKGSVRTEGDGSTYGPFFYTQDQIKEVVAYATERFIDVIPEIELPGHELAALSAYPELSCTGGPFKPRIIWGVEEDVMCVGQEETFQFFENVISEVAALFPSEYFHIGGDECPKSRWEKCPRCQARAASLGLKVKTDDRGVKHSIEEQLQSYAITRIAKHLASLDKKMIGWDEILEGGLTPGAIVMSWRGEEGGISAASQDHEVIMTPGSGGMYIDHYQGASEVEPVSIGGYAPLSKTYYYDPVPTALPVDKHQFILGAQVNMWTEYCADAKRMEYMIFPRVIAIAEATWSQPTRKDYADFERRINNSLARLDYHDINYHIPMPEGVLTQNVVFTEDSVVLAFSNTRNLPMVYTLDGTEPTAASTPYTTAIAISENTDVKIATLLQTDKMSKTRTVPVVKQTLSPAFNPDANPEKINGQVNVGKQPIKGTSMKVAQGLFTDQAAVSGAQFGETTIIEGFTNKGFDMNKPSLAVYEGYVELPEDGIYTFTTDMDELWVDGEQIINNPTQSRHNHLKVQKAVAKGKHSYKLVFNNMIKSGWPALWNEVGFGYKLPSGDKFERVTPDMLSL